MIAQIHRHHIYISKVSLLEKKRVPQVLTTIWMSEINDSVYTWYMVRIYSYYDITSYRFLRKTIFGLQLKCFVALDDIADMIFFHVHKENICREKLATFSTGGWFNKKMSSYQYRKSHCGDKTV